MPTYVYKFIDSGQTIDVHQSFADPTLTEAVNPVTGQLEPVKKVFTPVGVTFKGDGFYKTDNRNGSKRATAPSGESSSTTSTSSESTSSGSKEPAATAAAVAPKSSDSSGSKSSASKSSASKSSASSSSSSSSD
jgi:predicted nucleic acid-binding Zn ribbon protein